MDELLKKLKDYSRFLELQDSVPYWEGQIPELEARLDEMKWNLHQKELELLQMKAPNFFQRILGRAEEKKEKLSKQIREISAARTAAQWERDGLNKQIEAGKRELETLADSREIYDAARKEAILTMAQESRLMMEEISAFAPVALETAWHVLTALDAAGCHEQPSGGRQPQNGIPGQGGRGSHPSAGDSVGASGRCRGCGKLPAGTQCLY